MPEEPTDLVKPHALSQPGDRRQMPQCVGVKASVLWQTRPCAQAVQNLG